MPLNRDPHWDQRERARERCAFAQRERTRPDRAETPGEAPGDVAFAQSWRRARSGLICDARHAGP